MEYLGVVRWNIRVSAKRNFLTHNCVGIFWGVNINNEISACCFGTGNQVRKYKTQHQSERFTVCMHKKDYFINNNMIPRCPTVLLINLLINTMPGKQVRVSTIMTQCAGQHSMHCIFKTQNKIVPNPGYYFLETARNSQLVPKPSTKLLRVYVDNSMTFKYHISELSQ